ncbi:MAG: class II aldolase/adducin family protein [Ruminococcaceae bacterium]|nr:class II aldolase/adducin family protein [Oscillospiraceae bacterium]
MMFEMLHPADQIVTLMNRIYDHNMTTALGVNLSVRDAQGTVWISPGGVDKGNLRREDIMQIKPDGTISGIYRPSAEYPFHLAIYKKRPDIKAVLHAHPPTVIAGSLLNQIPNTSLLVDTRAPMKPVSSVSYEIPGSSALGDKLSAEFAKGINAVLMERHGIVIGDITLYQAFQAFETLVLCSDIQKNAKMIGGKISILSQNDKDNFNREVAAGMGEFISSEHFGEELLARRELCSFIRRAYEKQYITSEGGVFSCKLSDGSFLITPDQKDRRDIRPEELVWIKDGKREEGKIPSPTVVFHQAVYAKESSVKSIIEARPASAMAYAVTDKELDIRLLPEIYISLRNVQKYPVGSSFTSAEMLAEAITGKNPTAIIENDCVIATGTSLLKAFDKLEMLEYSAKALIEVSAFGEEPHGIDPEAFGELERAFNL